MMKYLALLAASFVAGHAAAGTPASLLGVWVEVNGPGAAMIAPCPDQSGQLCAIGLDRSNLKPPGQAQVVLSGLEPAGAGRWQGRYHDGGRKLPATLRLTGEDSVIMKVCIFIVCQSASYVRRP
jgi:uncharacterized protein (DUF2147 family)